MEEKKKYASNTKWPTHSLQIGEMYEVPEENDSEVEIVEEGEVILSEEDSDDAGCVHIFEVTFALFSQFKHFKH